MSSANLPQEVLMSTHSSPRGEGTVDEKGVQQLIGWESSVYLLSDNVLDVRNVNDIFSPMKDKRFHDRIVWA
jgi:hypothetical protein